MNNEPKVNSTSSKYQKVNKVLAHQNIKNREKILGISSNLTSNDANNEDGKNDSEVQKKMKNNNDSDNDNDYYSDDHENDGKNGGDDNDGESNQEKLISIKKSEYSQMMKDINELQNINILYEKENQRMVNKIIEKDNELKDLRAQFYDKRETMVQEINRFPIDSINSINSTHPISTNSNSINF